ncbi:MAG: hypothetical protein QOF65_1740 [Thermoleophilaceae bacterium]|nr:hypothetical protein [Thermoleophilaceae bacterium]MEA2437184.1 hypothetical protein [Thermoleophilaceae bacterium]
MKPIRIGCSGWNYQSWRGGEFYPKGCPPSRWLEHYSRVFDTVEVNSTFYRLASQKAVAHWIEQTPPGFVFALKASRYLTHIKRLADLDPGIARYYERIEPLTKAPQKLGPIVWQLPPNFQRDEDRLEAALAALPEGRHCFEFRHRSWFTDDVYALLRAYGAALVIGDRKGLDFQTYEMTADWTLVRFHHGHRGRRGNYSESELEEWAQRFEDWRQHVEIYAYFNNDWEVFAPRNARWMRKRLNV